MVAKLCAAVMLTMGLVVAIVVDTQMTSSTVKEARSSTESAQTLSSSEALAEVQITLNLLKDGETNIRLGDQKDVVMLLGVTGSGKSTLAQFLAGDNNTLKAVKTYGVMKIEDGNVRIGTSVINSKTIIPELVVEPERGTAFYDCPGFKDTRSPSHDITANYFIKKVLDHVLRVKLLFTISQTDLMVTRDGLTNLLHHACTLVTDVDKLGKGIFVVVTKVSNEYDFNENDDTHVLESDETVIDNIAGFMGNLRKDLRKADNEMENDVEKRTFRMCAIKLIDIFMLKDGAKYTRIGIFRKPLRTGLLNKSPELQVGKRNIETILNAFTEYASKEKEDFNYAISDNSKVYITTYLNRKLNDKIIASLKRLAKNIESKFVHEYNLIEDMYAFQSQLDTTAKNLRSITTVSKFSSPMQFVEEIARNPETTRADDGGIIIDIKIEIGYLEFFNGFSKSQGEYFSIVQGSDCFTQPQELVTDLNSWLLILLELYNKHSNYQYQVHKNSYSVRDLLLYGNEINLFNFNKSNAHIFLNEIVQSSENNMFSIVDDERFQIVALRDLNNIMNLASKQYASTCEQFLEKSLKDLAKEIMDGYLNKCKNEVTGFNGMRGLHQLLHRSSVSLEGLTKSSYTNAKAFKVEIMKTLREIGISGQDVLIHIEHLIAHTQLYQSFTNNTTIQNSKTEFWISLLKPAHEYIEKLEKWYEYILNAYDKLKEMSLEIHTDQKNGIDHWAEETRHQITEIHTVTFLLKLKELVPIKDDKILTDKSFTEIVLRYLNIVANIASNLATSYENAIVSELATLSTEIETKYSIQCRDSLDMRSLRNELDVGYNSLRRFAETEFADSNAFTKELLNVLQVMEVSTGQDAVSRISNNIVTFLSLKKLSIDETVPFSPSKWLSALFPAKNYLHNHVNWYTLLPDLYDKLSGYSFQKGATQSNGLDLSKWLIGVNKNNIKTFLEELSNLKLAGNELITTDNIDEVVFRDLNVILDKTLQYDTIATEVNGALTIKGQFVVLSKFQQEFQQTKYTSIEVFALNTVFIDVDIIWLGDELELTIIAPTWDIQGTRKIVLDGLPGASHETRAASEGEDGKPGKPGSNGGIFLGIGQTFMRGSSLSVSARGGEGGRGQDGGDGASYTITFDGNFAKNSICEGSLLVYRYVHFDTTDKFFTWERDYRIYPLVSGTSRGGGNGGAGGIGGFAGSIDIINLGTGSGIATKIVAGSVGPGGNGGVGGKGGVETWYIFVIRTNRTFGACTLHKERTVHGNVLPKGEDGQSNWNSKGRRAPNSSKKLSKSGYINRFKSFSERNKGKATTLSPLIKFLGSLEKNLD